MLSQSNRLPLAPYVRPAVATTSQSGRPSVGRRRPGGGGGLSTLRYKPEPSRAAIRVSRVHARNNIILAPRRIIGISGQVCFCHALPRCHTLSINKRGRKGGGRERERGGVASTTGWRRWSPVHCPPLLPRRGTMNRI